LKRNPEFFAAAEHNTSFDSIIEDVSKVVFNRKEREVEAKCAKLKHCICDLCDLCAISLRPLRFIYLPFDTASFVSGVSYILQISAVRCTSQKMLVYCTHKKYYNTTPNFYIAAEINPSYDVINPPKVDNRGTLHLIIILCLNSNRQSENGCISKTRCLN
jgi:hypothetical protein